MSEPGARFPEPQNPYGGPPGGSTPPPTQTAEGGLFELKFFFFIALLSTGVISVSGIVVWLVIHGRA
jgi:hypothetical protein